MDKFVRKLGGQEPQVRTNFVCIGAEWKRVMGKAPFPGLHRSYCVWDGGEAGQARAVDEHLLSR